MGVKFVCNVQGIIYSHNNLDFQQMGLKDYKLQHGDTVAILAPSSGKAVKFPEVYNQGIQNLKEIFGLKIKEYPTCKMNDEELAQNPQLRAKDINNAFADQTVRGIITTIGGDDSIRILPFLDKELIRKNPKLFMGYSDATVLLTFLAQLGLMSFHGPSVMAGFAQTRNLPPEFEEHMKTFLFNLGTEFEYKPYKEYTNGYPEWSDSNTGGKVAGLESDGIWHWLNGEGSTEGELFGGCIEALEFIKATDYWPVKDFWHNKVLFLETSEEKPTVDQIKYMLRNYGCQGIFGKISALLFGRAIFYTQQEKKELEEMILNIVLNEFGANDLPIVGNMDFGHTDPQLVLPLGAKVRINCTTKSFNLLS